MKARNWWRIIACTQSLVLLLVVAACTGEPQAVKDNREQNADQLKIYNTTQPIKVYDWSAYRQAMLEVVDGLVQGGDSFSYMLAADGRPFFGCPSMSYPIPFTAQITAPDQVIYNSYGSVIAQMEPWGGYSPPSTEATLFLCRLANGKATPVYSESSVATFPFPVVWVVDADGRGHFEPADASEAPALIQSSNFQLDITRPSQEELDQLLRGQVVPTPEGTEEPQ